MIYLIYYNVLNQGKVHYTFNICFFSSKLQILYEFFLRPIQDGKLEIILHKAKLCFTSDIVPTQVIQHSINSWWKWNGWLCLQTILCPSGKWNFYPFVICNILYFLLKFLQLIVYHISSNITFSYYCSKSLDNTTSSSLYHSTTLYGLLNLQYF